MLGLRVDRFFSLGNGWLLLLAAVAAGAVLGLACLVLSPLWVLAGLGAAGVGLAILKRPEIALLIILAATSGIVFEDSLPLLPIGVGSLHIPDLCLLLGLGLIGIRALVERDFKLVRTPLDVPLLAFWAVAVLTTILGVFRGTVDARLGVRALRVVTYYLTFFIVTQLVRRERQQRLLLGGLLLLALVVAGATVAQAALGNAVAIIPGRVEDLVTQGEAYRGVTRVVPPGRSLVLVLLITTTAVLALAGKASRARRAVLTGGWLLLGLALLVTFLRSYWVVAALAVGLLWLLVRGTERQRLLGWGAAVLLMMGVVLMALSAGGASQIARVTAAFLERAGTLGQSETLEESSLQWRQMENGYALRQIAARPLIGLGLSARYRPWDTRFDIIEPGPIEYDGRAHIHNGHLWVMVTTGLLGYACLAWLSARFLWRGFRHWRSLRDPLMRGVVLGFTLAYLAVLAGAIVNSTFFNWYWTPVLGIIMGVNEVAIANNEEEV